MADKAVPGLTADTALDGTEQVHVVQGSNSRLSTTSEIRYAGLKGALVKKSVDLTTQNLTSPGALVAWTAHTYDYGGWHSDSVNNTRLTVPAGVSRVRVMAQLYLANINSGNWVQLVIKKNGSASYDGNGQTLTTSTSTAIAQAETAIVEVAAGDYFELFVQVQTDTSVDFTASNCWFAIEKISD